MTETQDKPILFVTRTCSKCPMVKKYLARKNADYDIVDVTDDVKLLKPAYDISGQFTVPQLKIGDVVIVGVNYGKMAENGI